MKKLIIFLLFLVGGGTFAFGAQIPMQIIDPSLPSGGHPYAPVRPWYITQDDYAFTLAATPEMRLSIQTSCSPAQRCSFCLQHSLVTSRYVSSPMPLHIIIEDILIFKIMCL